MSMYRLSKISKVPYATLNDICNGKTQLVKCSAETVYRLAQALDHGGSAAPLYGQTQQL